MRRRSFVALASAFGLAGCRPGPSAAGILTAPARPRPRAANEEAGSDHTRIEEEGERYAPLAGFTDGFAPPDADELTKRQLRVIAAMGKGSSTSLIVEAGANLRYLSGVRWGRSERPFLMVLRADGGVAWVCPAFESRRAQEQLGEGADIRTWEEHEDPFALAAAAAGPGRISVAPDSRVFIANGVRAHRSKRGAVETDAEFLVETRMRKWPLELQRLRRANEATKAAIELASRRLAPGMRQSEFAAEVTAAQRAAGLSNVWALVLFGPAASFPHGTAEDRTLRPDDVVLVDTGGSLQGYCSDVSRTWVAGNSISDELRAVFDAVTSAQVAAMRMIQPGRLCGQVDAVARAEIEAAGQGTGYERFTHRLGHGIGLEVHEPPYLRPENRRVLDEGMTMSVEPGIYIPGKFGVRIEDIIMVSETGRDIFGPPTGPLEDPLLGHGVDPA